MGTSIKNTHQTPPIPSYVFRGHEASIHALHFFQQNTFFASGDSEGYIIIWRLTTRRPVACWKAHDGGVMQIKDWTGTANSIRVRLITHGRDHKLRVWRLPSDDSEWEGLSRKLPVDGDAAAESNQRPWLVHSMDVNALNFCAFGLCMDGGERRGPDEDRDDKTVSGIDGTLPEYPPVLLAMPNGLDNGGVDVFQLPSERRVSKLQSDKSANTGMVMCLRLFHSRIADRLMLVVGYEDGQVAVFARKNQNVMPVWVWERLMLIRPHAQPVLSLDVSNDHEWFVTSSADALVCKYRVPERSTEGDDNIQPNKILNTKHAGQQDLKIRSDGLVFATAGWDKNIRVYSSKSLKEAAVLQWHREGCFALAFAEVDPTRGGTGDGQMVASDMSAMERFKHERDTKVHRTHWLVAGSKDGKISLWDVY